MSKITLFYLENCPYCRNARRALAELTAEGERYGRVEIDWIEESRRPEIAERYDYYYVPAMFLGEHKLYEASPAERYEDCRARVREALETALGAENA